MISHSKNYRPAHRPNRLLDFGVYALLWALLLALALWGFWASIDIGIGWDEEAERTTLLINLAAMTDLLQGNTQGYKALLAHGDRYYGIGFHLPAYALSHLVQSIQTVFSSPNLFNSLNPPNPLNPLVLSHLSVWLCFLGSALLVRTLLLRLLANILFANVGMVLFALWPYLLGHGLMNIKDMPFVFAWLLCTVVALPLLQVPPGQVNHPSIARLPHPTKARALLLGVTTAWLLSIRISGVLIFLQYACFLASFWFFAYATRDGHRIPWLQIITIMRLPLAIFLPTFLISTIILYPIAWHNPLEIWHAIGYMSHHPWDGTTLTAGRFIAPGSKLYFYLGVWLLAKLPLIILIGLLLTPWALYRQALKGSQALASPGLRQSAISAQGNALALWVGLSISVLGIILALIILRVGLYNELRQTLFLFPLLFLVGISSLYYLSDFLSKTITLIGCILTGLLFAWDNLTLYPYNYTYLNEIARQRPAVQYFETDYFGFAAGQSARWLNTDAQATSSLYSDAQCIYAYPMHLLSYELNTQAYPCLKSSEGHARNMPAYAQNLLFITQRNLINFAIPEQCKQIHSEERTLPLSKNPLIMARLFDCNTAP